MQRYIFLLGREPSLSLAELKSIFWSVEEMGGFAFIEAQEDDIENYKNNLWGTIKIGVILAENIKKQDIVEYALKRVEEKTQPEKKLRVGFDVFVPSLSNLVFKVKDTLKKRGHSIRVVQHDNWRVKAATTIHEKLIEQGIELMMLPDKAGFIIAETVWIQDIEGYSQRDIERERSMTVGMMPPKIAQIMINLGTKGNKNMIIWDPFCGLGTTLIEALHSGYRSLRGSDIEPAMQKITQKNMENQPKGPTDIDIQTFILDAKNMDNYELSWPTVIVTEGMLGRHFSPNTLSQSWAVQERAKLIPLYQGFLKSAYQNPHIQRMVFCLPFWNIGRESLFMPDVWVLSPDWSLDRVCLKGKRYLTHLRPWQSVWREIVVVEK